MVFTLQNTNNTTTVTDDLIAALSHISPGLSETDLESCFTEPFLQTLNFHIPSTCKSSQHATGIIDGQSIKLVPDYTCWATSNTSEPPLLVVEGKAVNPNLMAAAIKQVKEQMLVTSAQFGLATNGLQIQLFQRHGCCCVPRTRLRDITPETIESIHKEITKHLYSPRRALTVMFWNNKGGVGKTTITANVAAILAAKQDLKVLVMNFDLQGDLNGLFGFQSMQEYQPPVTFYELLRDSAAGINEVDPQTIIRNKKFVVRGAGLAGTGWFAPQDTYNLDIIPGDLSLLQFEENTSLQDDRVLVDLLERGLYDDYDYIFIDAAPTWKGMGKLAACAADLLVPIVDNSGFAVNAVARIQEYLSKDADDFAQYNVSPPEIVSYIINSRLQNQNLVQKIQDELRAIDLNVGCELPNYVAITRSIERGMPFVYSNSGNPAVKSFTKLAEKILLSV